MSGKAVGRTAAALPWLCPNTDSLIRLAENPAALARPCATDPALLAFLLRFTPPPAQPPQPKTDLFCLSSLASATLPDAASVLLAASSDDWVPDSSEFAQRYRSLVSLAAGFARRLAEQTHRACPERAVAVVTLAALGWLAVAAVDSNAVTEPLNGKEPSAIPELQVGAWGLDQNAIARRLATRWRLPDWLVGVLGNFNLPLSTAQTLVLDVGLFAVAQLALLETEQRGSSLGLTLGAHRPALLEELALNEKLIEDLWAQSTSSTTEPEPLSVLDPNPHRVPLLPNLLKLAAESRRRNGAALVSRLEDRLDDLHHAVAQAGSEVQHRVREEKLAALAEVAAGAGHEINNPLAIISTNAQRLFRTEPDPDRGASLQTIIRQTERIAGIIRDLMYFARPPKPNPRRAAVVDLLRLVRDELASFAVEKGVRVEWEGFSANEFVRCDSAQIKSALVAVMRNGIEAAGRDGWVRIGYRDGEGEFVRFEIEDSGPGLSEATQEHCFDPFYCGRSAGRGRGLGLPIAWQYVRQNGGELCFEATNEGPTRFVLTLPRSMTLDFVDRQSA